ncbi:HYR domain-containing protein [Flavobacterium ginsengiterrae]|uniref:HYR domain-containing protein n=1 Tax=Flavobacterium ginsengiterrae TaxID=871695 RepID=UPI0031E7E983
MSYSASAQFYTTHYIAPAPWQYFNDANEIVIATNSTTNVSVSVSKSDGTLVTNLTAVKGTPAVYRFIGTPSTTKAYVFDTVLDGAGLIVRGSAPISINLRNVASDALSGKDVDKDIKGNAALTSFGDAGLGIRFRVGYYRDGSLGNFNGYGDQRPIYTIMATANNTVIKINGVVTATLNTGQSYLFKANIGSLVESSNPVVMNTSAAIDTPGGCGDSAYNQIPPEAVLGTEYFLERGTGNNIAEQTTVVATKDNTKVTIESYTTNGTLSGTPVTVTLAKAGNFYTFINGVKDVSFTASHIVASERVAVYSGTAQGCEVDISTIAPVSECGGSNFIETAKFRNYGSGTLDYFGYILLRSGSEVVKVNGKDVSTISGVSARYQIGTTGWYLINFNSKQIGSPNFLSIESNAKLTVSIVQQDGGFSMAGFFSNFAVQPEEPTFTYISGGGCSNNSALLKTQSGLSPYQWYLNGVAIAGANSDTYTATKTGAYSVASTLTCGAQTQSKPVSVTLCTDLGVTKTVDIATPCVGSNVEFTIKLNNLGVNNATGVSINDLLPSGYTFVSSTQSIGSYSSTTGVWSIGDVNGGVTETLKITAKVNASGVYNNTASLPATTADSNPANNSASVSTTPNPLPTASITGALTACLNTTLTAVTNAASPTYVWYKNDVVISGQTASTLAVNSDGNYKVKVRNGSTGCEQTSVASTVKVSDTDKPAKPVLADVTGQCSASVTAPTTTDNCAGTVTGTTTDPLTYNAQGTYTVTWSFNDGNGNVETATQKVTVNDTQKPTITCPSNVTVSADANSCSATGVVLGTPTTSDNCSGAVTVSNNAPTSFPLGNTTVTWTAKDAAGNTQTCTQTVTVNDTQKPTITCPSNVTVSADANSCSATGVVLGTPATSDNCSGAVTVSNNAPTSFPLGNTAVTWTAKDAAGNTQTCTQTVTVNDTQKPTITCPSNVTVSADANSCSATGVVLGTPTTSDNCSGAVTVSNNAPTSFPLGNTTVTWTAKDAAGNTQTCTQTVTVNDTQKPTITCPSNVTVSADANSCSATGVVLGTPTTSDNCSGAVTVSNNAPTSFPLGNTTVTWTATDAAGNTQTCTQTVKVIGPIVANEDKVNSINGYTGGTAILNVLANDLLNCNAVVRSEVDLTLASALPSVLTFDIVTGKVTVKPNTPKGTYSFDYKICEIANSGNCSTTTVEVKVDAPAILAVKETLGPINGAVGGTTTSLIASDKLNGVQAVIGSNPGEVTLTGTAPAGLTINADGTITVAKGVKEGNYDVTYEICDNNNIGNCSTATSTVVVTAGVLVANLDNAGSVTGGSSSQTLVNIFDNDTYNGSKLNPSDVKLTSGTDPKGYLTIGADGNTVLKPNAPAGTYEVTYEICELLNAGNCSTNKVQVTVTAPAILAVKENLGPINGSVGGNTTSLIASDKLNEVQAVIGSNPGEVTLTGTAPAGLTINADGTITVAKGVKEGNYDVTYEICDNNNIGNCSTATSTVVVTAGVLVANLDNAGSVTGGSSSQTLVNIFDNDTYNGSKLNPSDVKLTAGTDPKGYLTIGADGNAVLKPNAPAGTYEVTYEICELLNAGNCSTNKVQVTVTAPGILAVKETLGPINGAVGGNTTSLIASDKLNGVQAVIGSNPGEVTLTGTAPTGLTINADGTITVAKGVKEGNYDVTYEICDNNNAGNCSTATSTVVVTAGVLVANLDNAGSVTGGSSSQTLINIFDNDTYNGSKLNPSDVKLTAGTDPKGYLTIGADGNAVLKPNAPAGTYEVTYEICELLNNTNCSTNKVQVTVTAPGILAVKETLGPINGSVGGNTTSLIASDKLNGVQAVIGSNPGEVTLTGTAPAGLTINADGTITVAKGVKEGNYDVTYEICDNNNAGNCSTTTSTVVVTAGVLVANLDNAGSVTGGSSSQTLINIFDNDTYNGSKLNPSDVKLTAGTDPKGYLTIGADGNAVLKPNAPAGTYEVTYEICEVLNAGNCSTNKVQVTVTAPGILAVKETLGPINGSVGGTTTSLIASDKLNGVQAVIGSNPGEVTLTGTAPAGLTINADGTITVAKGVKEGNYDVTYEICDNNNAGNCSTTTSTVVVTAGVLVANLDNAGSVTGGSSSQTLINIFDNDTYNGSKLNPSDVKLTAGTDPKGYLTIGADGNAVLKPNAPAGTYEVTYEICEVLNTGNCSTNKVQVTVTAPAIVAVAENLGSVNGSIGGTTTVSVILNDKLNGAQAVIGENSGEVILSKVNLPAGFVLEADGRVTIPANTPKGTYEIEYRICEVTNTGNCDTAKSTVEVTVGTLIANPDENLSVVGINQPQTIVNVFDNDTYNGSPVKSNDVKLSIEIADPKGFLTLNPDGTVTLAPNAPRGTYELTYKICEVLNDTNCTSAVVTVTVDEPTITVTADSFCSNNVPYVSYTVKADNFTPTNLVTIKWIDSANNVVATQTNMPLSGTVLWPGAVVDSNDNGVDWPGWLFANGQWTEGADGFENTRTGVTMEFSVNPTASVSVNYPQPTAQCNARPTFIIIANNDTAGPVDTSKGNNTGTNIFDNDKLNGLPLNPSDVSLSTILPNANLVLNADGSVSVKAGTPSGSYQLTYQICSLNSSNCAQAVVTVVVQNTVTPVEPQQTLVLTDDALVAVDGINGSLEFVNVLDNDLLNGLPINPVDVVIKNLSGDSNFEFNADGTVNVKPNTPGKTYTIVYQVCEKANPNNCSTATLNVFVEVPAIAVVKTAVFNDENNNNVANAGETITYKFKITNTGNVALKNVTISDLLPGIVMTGQPINLDVNEVDENNFTGVYTIKQSDINAGSVTNQATATGKSERGVTVEDKSDDSSNTDDKPTVLPLNGCMIKVLNAFSPNGDQKNERFYIQGLECYPDNTVEIYNRWGVLVFDVAGYNNEDRVFKGYSYGRTTMKQSEGLPVGTYFYILKYKDSDSNPHEKSGYLYINK